MGADNKIGQWRAPGAAGAAVGENAFSSQEGGFPRQGMALENVCGQSLFKLLHALESDGNFGEDDRIDHQN